MSQQAETIASQSTDTEAPTAPPSTQERASNSTTNDHKMENDLEINKDDKPSTTKSDEVAGRKDKGLGLADKLIGKSL